MLQERVATHGEGRGESQDGSGASDLEGNQCRREQEEGRAPGGRPLMGKGRLDNQDDGLAAGIC